MSQRPVSTEVARNVTRIYVLLYQSKIFCSVLRSVRRTERLVTKITIVSSQYGAAQGPGVETTLEV